MSLIWVRDHAADGWRSRVWTVDLGEMIVYDDGHWLVCVPGRYDAAATGEEKTPDLGKARAAKVYEALTGTKPVSREIRESEREQPAKDMSDEQIAKEIETLGQQWDEFRAGCRDEGMAGDPGEWMVERMDELETEQRRRIGGSG